MSVDDKEFKELLTAVEQSLRHFESRPAEPGFDQEIYDELRRVRESLLRARRDKHDPNVKRDSHSPSGPPASPAA
ncbi:MAG: hypothetical protein JWQ62_526 [Lacunisphaera sp.]|jgi:hypothetical protein|nr:hypothetical protein [Lacunisphaera sp.]